MRIGIDARFITDMPRRGIGNYSLNLIKEIVKIDAVNNYIFYIATPDIEKILPRASNVEIKIISPSFYPLWENILLPIAAKKDRLDILHCLGNTAPLLLSRSTKLIVTIHDVIFLNEGESVPKPLTFYQKLGRIYRSFIVPRIAASSKYIITISEYSRQEILNNIPTIDPRKVFVSYQSCDLIFKDFQCNVKSIELASRETLKKPFIFCLGAEDPRKNTLRVVRAYLNLFEKNLISENIVICGYNKWENSESFRLVKEAEAQDKVIFLGFIENKELAFLYHNAIAFIYPSISEGFGIPMLEAFSSGCPVIASDTTSIPEIGGNAALYFNPLNLVQIENAIIKIVNSSHIRDMLQTKGYERANQFTWSDAAQRTIKIYMNCMSESNL